MDGSIMSVSLNRVTPLGIATLVLGTCVLVPLVRADGLANAPAATRRATTVSASIGPEIPPGLSVALARAGLELVPVADGISPVVPQETASASAGKTFGGYFPTDSPTVRLMRLTDHAYGPLIEGVNPPQVQPIFKDRLVWIVAYLAVDTSGMNRGGRHHSEGISGPPIPADFVAVVDAASGEVLQGRTVPERG